LAAAATEINLHRFISARLLLEMEKQNALSFWLCYFYLEGCINFVQAAAGIAFETNISPLDLAVLACTLKSNCD
jgi:hypothetical protein